MTIQDKITNAYKETRRIIRLTRKPKSSEFNETAKITGAGMLVIGAVGYLVFALAKLAGV